ncbi:MAG: 1-deoxy-D-xylulose-5-phosphate synthase [Clostridia bacterium]|nr:1-deoxy-D-xylulose-5-phosphate synthase [Clostridia bacterium]
MYLENITCPQDVKKLDIKQLKVLCDEIRQYLLDVVLDNGGHLASNLGVVELTVALHYVFDDADKILWDVGHQSYVHKILTGRKDQLKTLRQKDGLSGFCCPSESEKDAFVSGHASNSVSAALGICQARDMQNQKFDVVSVIGDGALTGGMVYEALNNVNKKNMLVVLNDNNMSISKNVGNVSMTLSKLRLASGYNKFKYGMTKFLSAIPLVGKFIVKFFGAVKNFFKSLFGSNTFFSNFGIKYIGPFDGNNVKKMVKILKSIKKQLNRPILLHVVTKKGKGYAPAEQNPQDFHGVSPKNQDKKQYSFSSALGEELSLLAQQNDKICAVCAAMPSGTGIESFAKNHPDKFFDVGIAEQHAVTFSAGLAKNGMKPFVAVYSTFLQRAYDQILHDVCIDKLPVTFCIDRAGFVGQDGETHQGLFDLSYLGSMPNMTIIAPKDVNELKQALKFAIDFDAPLAIRYPKDCDVCFEQSQFEYAKWQYLLDNGGEISIFAVGPNCNKIAMQVAQNSQQKINVINASFVKPTDKKMLLSRINDKKWIVMEENQSSGGLGQNILSFVSQFKTKPQIKIVAVDDKFVRHSSIQEQLSENGFDMQQLKNMIE